VKYLLLAPELFESEGGITRILRLYLKALCENAGSRDDVQFISLNDSMVDTSVAKRFSTDRLVAWKACRRSKLQFILSAFKRGLSSDKIVCGHIGQLPVAWAISLIRPRMSYYLVAHGIEVWRPFSMLEKAALRRAKCILCVSDYTRGQVLEHCPMPKETTAVLYNALDPTLQTSPARPPDPDSYVILTVSRLSLSDSYKGIEHLIAAMPEVRKSIPGARLRVVGRGDGLNKLQGKAHKLDMPGAVEFAGFRSDAELAQDFALCRVFALPSQGEGFGLVYLEAMAHGRPCIGARSGGVPEVISPDSGLLVEYGDVPAIAAAILQAFSRQWEMSAIIERVRHFSYSNFKKRFIALLNS
jgi:phosphatidylinositol alpha-1,6-mannosyltransferase